MVKQLYGLKHLHFTYWVYTCNDIAMLANFNGSVHDDAHGMSLLDQWTGEKPDLQLFSMLPFLLYSDGTYTCTATVSW